MRLIRYRDDHREPMLALHRSALVGIPLGMSQQEDEADLMAIEQVYLLGGGEFLLGFIDERLVAMGGFKRLSDTVAELKRMRIEREFQAKGYVSVVTITDSAVCEVSEQMGCRDVRAKG